MEVDPTRHLDRAAEGDLAVALREVEVAHRELGALDIDREVDARSARDVLDVAVAAVLARRNRPGRPPSPPSSVRRPSSCRGGCPFRIGRQRERRNALRVGRDQLALALVPAGEEIVRSGAQPTMPGWVIAGEAHAGNMARSRVDAVDVPDRLPRLGEDVGQEAAAVLGGEDARVAPFVAPLRRRYRGCQRPGCRPARPLDLDRAGQVMAGRRGRSRGRRWRCRRS